MFIKFLAASVLALAMASPVLAQSGASAEAQPASPSGAPCVLLFGGAYQATNNALINGLTLKMNAAVNDDLSARMKGGGYTIYDFFRESTSADETDKLVVEGISKSKCPEIVQLASTLSNPPDANSPGGFGFSVLVFHLEKQSGGDGQHFRVVGDFQKDYEYLRTEEVLKTLAMDDVAERILGDIEASGTLAKMKAPPASTAP